MTDDAPRKPRNAEFWQARIKGAQREQKKALDMAKGDRQSARKCAAEGALNMAARYHESVRGWLLIAAGWSGVKRVRQKIMREAAINDAADAAGITIPEMT